MPQMPSGSTPYTWNEAISEFLTWQEGHRAEKTVRFYRVQLRQLTKWADENRVGFKQFGKRDKDRYLAERIKTVGCNTLSHDGVAAKTFFKWCARYDLIERSPLAEYEVRRLPRPPKYMPTEEDLSTLLKALIRYWDPDESRPGRRLENPRNGRFGFSDARSESACGTHGLMAILRTLSRRLANKS